jgi:hypothetical protein
MSVPYTRTLSSIDSWNGTSVRGHRDLLYKDQKNCSREGKGYLWLLLLNHLALDSATTLLFQNVIWRIWDSRFVFQEESIPL